MMAPVWMILVPTIPRRAALFARLMDRLLPQLPTYGTVRVLSWLNQGVPRLGELRDRMLDYAAAEGAEYVSFIDDDDLVPAYYVAKVLRALEQEPDHVGFPVEYFKDGELHWPCDHSLRHRKWETVVDRSHGQRKISLLRDFTHIDPMRTAIARRGRFGAAAKHAPEDRVWVREVRPWLRGGSEVYIPEIMYHYYWTPSLSAWDSKAKLEGLGFGRRPSITHPHLIWHPESL